MTDKFKKKLPSQYERLVKKIYNLVNYESLETGEDEKESKEAYEKSVIEYLEYLFRNMNEEEIKNAINELSIGCNQVFHSYNEVCLAVNSKFGTEVITPEVLERTEVINIVDYKGCKDYSFRMGGVFIVVHDKGRNKELQVEVS